MVIKRLEDLEIYQNSLEMSRMAWKIFNGLSRSMQFNIGDQFLRSVDSVGANIAEGFGRYHYKDSLKFYYNARGSLIESRHWLTLLSERKLITEEIHKDFYDRIEKEGAKLNQFINYHKSNLQEISVKKSSSISNNK